MPDYQSLPRRPRTLRSSRSKGTGRRGEVCRIGNPCHVCVSSVDRDANTNVDRWEISGLRPARDVGVAGAVCGDCICTLAETTAEIGRVRERRVIRVSPQLT